MPSIEDYQTINLGRKSFQCRDLAAAMNRRLETRHLQDRQVKVYKGAMTLTRSILESAVTTVWALGADKAMWREMEDEKHIQPEAVMVIRHPATAARLGLRDPELGKQRVAHMVKARKKREQDDFVVITAAQLGLSFQWVFGSVGTLTRTFGHYTGGLRAPTRSHLIATARSVHAQHMRQGWGGGSYGPMFADDGSILLLNPIGRKAAGVAGHNTGSVHLNCPGTTGHSATDAQERAVREYMAKAHTSAIPSAYRAPVDLRRLRGHVHKDVNATACPGDFTPMYRRCL